MNTAYEAQTSDFKISVSVLTGSNKVWGHISEAKIYPRLISNSGKGKIRKNQFASLLEFFEKNDEVAFFDFDFRVGGACALYL